MALQTFKLLFSFITVFLFTNFCSAQKKKQHTTEVSTIQQKQEMTFSDFLTRLYETIPHRGEYTNSSEEYFRQLLFQVELHSNRKVTGALLIKIFKNSFFSESVPFNEKWNDLKEPNIPYSQKMSNHIQLEHLKNTIRFFIADLRRMGHKTLKNPYRGYGVTSPSGATWYSFNIGSIVNQFISFINDSSANTANTEESKVVVFYWTDISQILLIGKGYE